MGPLSRQASLMVLLFSSLLPVRQCFVTKHLESTTATSRLPSSLAKCSHNETASSAERFSIEEEEDQVGSLDVLRQRAASLRIEAASLQQSLQSKKQSKLAKERAAVEKWMNELLFVSSSSSSSSSSTTDDATSLMRTVEQVTERLRDGRYSAEQVNKVFAKLLDERPETSRSNCSPLVELLVDACGQLDCVERSENANKRWSGRVERDLRKRLFALDWGLEFDDDMRVVERDE